METLYVPASEISMLVRGAGAPGVARGGAANERHAFAVTELEVAVDGDGRDFRLVDLDGDRIGDAGAPSWP